jgi:hypothetical protein
MYTTYVVVLGEALPPRNPPAEPNCYPYLWEVHAGIAM